MTLRAFLVTFAALGVIGVAWAGEPCGACQAAKPCESESPRQRIVVHVPPPEVVFEPAPCCLFKPKHRLLHKCGEHCGTAGQQQSSVTSALLTPMSMTHTVGSLTVMGAGNIQAAGYNLFGAAPGLTFGATPVMQSALTYPGESTGAFDGLRAIHAAEVRAAGIAGARAQHDAELRSTLAALDRARASMGQMAPSDTPGAQKDLVDTLKQASTTTQSLSVQFTDLKARLDKLESQVSALAVLVNDIDVRTSKRPQNSGDATKPGGK